MISAAQKKAKDNFKKAIAYRKKTGCDLKAAFAHVYGRKVGAVKKKAAPKKKAVKKTTIVSKMSQKDLQKAITQKLTDKGISKDFLKNNFVFTKLGAVNKKKAPPKKKAAKKAAPKKIITATGIGRLAKDLIKRLNEVQNEIEQRESVIVSVMSRKKDLIEKNGAMWYKKWIKDAKKIVAELKKHKTELKSLI